MKKAAAPILIAFFFGIFCFVSCWGEKTETMKENIENTKQEEESIEQMDGEESLDKTAEEEKEAENTFPQGQEEKEAENTPPQGQEEKETENMPPRKQEGTGSEKPEDNLEKPQQVTGDVDIDFEGMINEIDREIEEQIDNSLPEQDFEK